ncbi:MAG TPA: aminotransferase class I/II-fold pyridoxal phosphate-dependent enzyme [Anaerolineales bacterium]|nr:aminotransferase class I/II-fold pyridoxal phosphate-dependent enzyme [Anaerolineae bacterium]HIQ01640.1 aminotransferase class I/II-fold pyridoxal phosphate-dependent enzyme [Anaerolineales bacterium]
MGRIDKGRKWLRLQRLSTGQYATNCYLLTCPQTHRAMLVDPGGDPEAVLALCQGVRVARILLTHGHFDHLLALGPVRAALGAPVGAHPADADAFGIEADFDLRDGMMLGVGRRRVRIVHIPGHTPGSVALRFDRQAIVGDAVFPGGPGHTESPESLATLLLSLQRTVFTWPDDTTLYPGHGEPTTVGAERPAFQAFLARPRPTSLCGDVTWQPARPPLARRTEPFIESVIREMTRLGDEAGAINLSQGLPDFDPPAEVVEAALISLREGHHQYTFTWGALDFRQAVAEKCRAYNHIPADPETMVTITCGVSEAVVASIFALTDPGDEVVILEPWYENYVPACILAGVTPRFVPLREPNYTFDPEELRSAFGSRTRLVLVNTPHNPTGRVFTREELSLIADLCQAFNVVAVTDEIYEHILYDGREHISIGSLPGMADRTVTCSGLGKTYAVTGWRVGWAVAAPRLTALIRKVHDYLTICAPAPFQRAGLAALRLPEAYYRRMRAEYAARRAILLEGLDWAGLPYREPEGAYYVMADIAPLGWHDDRAFAEHLAREVGVAVVPGSSFYHGLGKGTTRVRFNFAKRRETLKEAVRRLRRLRPV